MNAAKAASLARIYFRLLVSLIFFRHSHSLCVYEYIPRTIFVEIPINLFAYFSIIRTLEEIRLESKQWKKRTFCAGRIDFFFSFRTKQKLHKIFPFILDTIYFPISIQFIIFGKIGIFFFFFFFKFFVYYQTNILLFAVKTNPKWIETIEHATPTKRYNQILRPSSQHS